MTQEYLEPAVELLIENYKREQEQSRLLPAQVVDEPERMRQALAARLVNPGVAVVADKQLLAYLVTGSQFQWKGQQAVLVPEYCHSAVVEQKPELYQRMYMQLAQQWLDNRIHMQIIGHFAHDALLQETLYQLGFGAILAERLRDCSAIAGQPDVEIREEKDVSRLVDIQLEHNQYYFQSPIFIRKETERHEALADLEAHAQLGDRFLVYYEEQKPCAYMIVGTSALDGEGFLLRQTNTAQIKSAYARPEMRGQGVGKAILHRAIQWAQEQGYERIFVEHETANFYGGRFWPKYFTPYLYFSMRYIDNTL